MLRYNILKPQDCLGLLSGIPPLFTNCFGVFSVNLNFKATEGLPASDFDNLIVGCV